MLRLVTLAGWDNRTTLDELYNFCQSQQPHTVEIAVLASPARAGVEDRYPDPEHARDILATARQGGQLAAVHFCGGLARHLLLGAAAVDNPDVLLDKINRWHGASVLAHRIQINVPDGAIFRARHTAVGTAEGEVPAAGCPSLLSTLPDRIPGKGIILQARGAFTPLEHQRLSWLYDKSAGKGQPLDVLAAPRPPADQFVGYAGGLGPDNVAEVVAFLTSVASQVGGNFWVDMESGIRRALGDDGSFVSIDKCHRVMEAVQPFLAKRES